MFPSQKIIKKHLYLLQNINLSKEDNLYEVIATLWRHCGVHLLHTIFQYDFNYLPTYFENYFKNIDFGGEKCIIPHTVLCNDNVILKIIWIMRLKFKLNDDLFQFYHFRSLLTLAEIFKSTSCRIFTCVFFKNGQTSFESIKCFN